MCVPFILRRFSLVYFTKVPSPFDSTQSQPRKKQSKDASVIGSLDIVECCYKFLKSDTTFFKNTWKWSQFIELYCHGSNASNEPRYRLVCNYILALLFNMTEGQLQTLNKNIPTDVIVDFQLEHASGAARAADRNEIAEATDQSESVDEKLVWNFSNDTLTNVEGVTLPIFNQTNYRFFAKHEAAGELERIVRVDSTKINLRSLALGVAAGKAICLAGPVGSGKTTLVEYLARRSGRIAPKLADVERVSSLSQVATKENTDTNGVDGQKKSKRKRQIAENKGQEDELLNELYKKPPVNGFLRIQLGDQTDSKMLLGQYRCTDVPGEFVWQPGVLTQVWLMLLSNGERGVYLTSFFHTHFRL